MLEYRPEVVQAAEEWWQGVLAGPVVAEGARGEGNAFGGRRESVDGRCDRVLSVGAGGRFLCPVLCTQQWRGGP